MSYQLVLSDMDSTLIQQEVIDAIAARLGVGPQVSEITTRAMNGEIDFATALVARVALLEGADTEVLKDVADAIQFNEGAEELLAYCMKKRIPFGVVSGGFIEVIELLGITAQLSLIRANSLEIKNGRLTGKLRGKIIDRAAKASTLVEFARKIGVQINQTIAIGDGANDLEMIQAAGLGVAFRAKPALKAVADLQIEKSLAELIPYLES